MSTIVVWVLVAYLDGFKAGSSVVIDNIAMRESCLALAQTIEKAHGTNGPTRVRCVPVRKVRS